MPRLQGNIKRAIRCGPIPKARTLASICRNPRSDAERIIAFSAYYLVVPEGMSTGKPLRLEPFQIAFILSVFDNPHGTRHAYLSLARRNGKTFLVAIILLAYIIGPMAEKNTAIASAAMSRDQAALCFKLMEKMLMLSPKVAGTYRTIPSQKMIVGLNQNTEYSALSADAKTGFGKSLRVILLDEAGQITGPNNSYIDMLTTSQGSYEDSLMITISTQAPSDADFLSIMMDQAERSNDPHTVCHLYTADPDCDVMDKREWLKANPGLDIFRSRKDIREQLITANAIPSKEAGARNLLLNQRVAQEAMFISPSIWNRNKGEIDHDLFRNSRVIAGLDLSSRNDLTACVLSAKDPKGRVHVLPFVFCPTQGVEERSKRDRAPYDVWIKQGFLIPLGGDVMDYEQIAIFMKSELKRRAIKVKSVEFDRWHIDDFKAACRRAGAFPSAEWNEVGQGFKDMGPRCDSLLNNMTSGNLRTGNHPLLVMAASNAVAVIDPAGNTKLDKRKSTQRIDPIIAMLMSCYPLLDGETGHYTIDSLIG